MGRKHYWSQAIQAHVQSQKSLYIFVVVLFLTGVVFGAVIVNMLTATQRTGLSSYLGHFFKELGRGSIADSEIALQHSIGEHLKTIGLMWLLGLSVIGIPILCLFLFFKGMVIGFTVGFLVQQFSWTGLWFAFVSIVPTNLFVIPAMMIVSVAGVYFSVDLVKNHIIAHRGSLYPKFVSYCGVVVMMACLMMLSSLVEAYLSPMIMRGSLPEIAFMLPHFPSV
ncbi:stage II sporulation protein M [Baia soyae]|uniref:Stage II sporulation protein M n=1 Tax=Baia soyae TaxID=1544746 RepID=A0A4R2S1K6_9BACL|nr:stage II sporulation protein M [Baia soyae]TCP69920.1 stage II sporulation protein M [Baia soyae]